MPGLPAQQPQQRGAGGNAKQVIDAGITAAFDQKKHGSRSQG